MAGTISPGDQRNTHTFQRRLTRQLPYQIGHLKFPQHCYGQDPLNHALLNPHIYMAGVHFTIYSPSVTYLQKRFHTVILFKPYLFVGENLQIFYFTFS